MIHQIVQGSTEKIKEFCAILGLNRKTLKRWLNPPKPVEEKMHMPLFQDYSEDLKEKAEALEHRAQRTLNSHSLHEDMAESTTRRQRQEAINQARKEANKLERQQYKTVKWNHEMTCWAMDDTHSFTKKDGERIWIHNIKDLASQYLLAPITGSLAKGQEVADNLRQLFERFGAPLFFKRDNGSNLCAKEVNELFVEYGVIALTSPTYYSRYNGSIEQSNCQLKKQIDHLSENYKCPINEHTIEVLAKLAAHEENTKLKRSLNRRAAAFMFLSPNNTIYRKEQRKEIYEEIKTQEKSWLEKIVEPTQRDKKRICRKAIEHILDKRQFITKLNEETVTHLMS